MFIKTPTNTEIEIIHFYCTLTLQNSSVALVLFQNITKILYPNPFMLHTFRLYLLY